jgi:hypothetical protein
MIKLELDLLGTTIQVTYQIHDNDYIEWRVLTEVGTPTHHTELLFTMIRMHYTIFIEGIIKEHYHWKMEAEARGIDPNVPF